MIFPNARVDENGYGKVSWEIFLRLINEDRGSNGRLKVE